MCTANSFALTLFMPKFVCLAAMRVRRACLPACLMPRRHRDASGMRPCTDSYANDIMRRLGFGTGNANENGLSSGRIVMTDFNLTVFLHVILSLCHISQTRKGKGEGAEEWEWGAGHKSNRRRRLETPPLPLCDCGSGQTCHGSVRMDRSDTFGGIWRGMRQKWRRGAFFFRCFLHSHVICRQAAAAAAAATCQLPSHHSSPGEDRQEMGPRLGRSADRQNWRPPS